MKTPNEYTDEQIIRAILGTEAEREAVFTYLYRDSGWRQWVIAEVRRTGGKEQDGEDVFQDAIIIFDRAIRSRKYQGKSGLKTYFFAIAKRRWFNIRRIKDENLEPLPEMPELEGFDPEDWLLSEEERQKVWDIIVNLSARCRKSLVLYIYSFSNDMIAEVMGWANSKQAKKAVYECREKFRELVQRRGLF